MFCTSVSPPITCSSHTRTCTEIMTPNDGIRMVLAAHEVGVRCITTAVVHAHHRNQRRDCREQGPSRGCTAWLEYCLESSRRRVCSTLPGTYSRHSCFFTDSKQEYVYIMNMSRVARCLWSIISMSRCSAGVGRSRISLVAFVRGVSRGTACDPWSLPGVYRFFLRTTRV